MRLLILDRDGVINHDSEDYIRSVADWKPIDGSLEAIADATRQGWTVVIATNQSGLARGYFSRRALENIHQQLKQRVAMLGGRIAAIAYCPHGPDDNCKCRKPAPGMVQELLQRFACRSEDAIFVGDSLRDLQAAVRSAVQPVLVLTGNGEKTATHRDLPATTRQFANLDEVVQNLESFAQSSKAP